MARKESRGLHYTLDYPAMLDNPTPTVLTPPISTSEALVFKTSVVTAPDWCRFLFRYRSFIAAKFIIRTPIICKAACQRPMDGL